MSEKEIYGSVLLVCIYNRFGNVLTHDYFYQLFSQYGEVVKILIFDKAKVWKTFVEFEEKESAKQALRGLDNRIVFEDGSKMNIFSSKLKQVRLQNCNLGGVNYEQLRLEQEIEKEKEEGPRARRSTNPNYSSFIPIDEEEYVCYKPQFEGSTKYSYDSERQPESTGSYNSFSIDQQFLELARESEEFRKLEIESKKSQSEEKIRLKSKTMLSNPNMDLFLKENIPCKVLFVRSIPKEFSTRSLYNIFSNFGVVAKVVLIQDKGNCLIEFDNIDDAIVAKDELNYSKPEMKIFYSHYQTLTITEENGGEVFHAVKREPFKGRTINPPSEILYITLVVPEDENELKVMCSEIGVEVNEFSWKLNNNKWACLVDFGTVDNSLLVMGLLQGMPLKSGKSIRLSFTKQKLAKSNIFSS